MYLKFIIRKEPLYFIMLNKRGAMLIEYGLIFALLVVVAMSFSSSNLTQLVTNPFNQASSALDGKSKINSSDSFWKAINRDNSPIVYNGVEYNGIRAYMNGMVDAKVNLTSGAIGSNFSAGTKPSVNGKEYANASTPVNEMLTQNNYSGHEDITWSVIGSNLYVYDEKKLTTADVGKNFKVDRYDLTSKDPTPTQVNVRFVKSGKGNYGYLTP